MKAVLLHESWRQVLRGRIGGSAPKSPRAAPAGTRWYHTHDPAEGSIALGTYSGQFSFLLVEGGIAPDPMTPKFYLAVHHWEGWFVAMIETTGMQSSCAPQTVGSEVGYKYATFNAHRPGDGEPIRLKAGQCVLMRLLNASATENCVLARPGHKFRILTTDGNSVPYPRDVEMLSLEVAECVEAIVEMNNPGVWILGSTIAKKRDMGLGLVVEDGGTSGPSVWNDLASAASNCPQSADSGPAPDVGETFILTFRDSGPLNDSRFDTWTINNPGPSTTRVGPTPTCSRCSAASDIDTYSATAEATNTQCASIGGPSR